MTSLEIVLFDLDGTLLDSAPDICQAVNQMLADDGRPTLGLEDIIPLIGDGAMELCRRALLKTGGVAADDLYPYVQKYIAAYRSLPPDPAQIFPHVREVLEELRAAGVRLAICTNKVEGSTRKLLESLDLIRYFDFIAGGDSFAVHKPHPGHITGILDALDLTRKGALFVGDGPRDTEAAARAGIPCFIVTHGYGIDYDHLPCDRRLSNLAELPAAIKDYGFSLPSLD